MMKRQVHLIITILGTIVSFLEWFAVDNPDLGRSILLLTLLSNVYLHLVSEFAYYRRNNAVIASSQFLTIPYLTIILATFLENGGLIVSVYSSQGIVRLEVFLESLLILPCYILLTVLNKRYYQRRYTGFVLSRKMHGPVKFPLFFNTLTVIILYIQSSSIDFIGLSGFLLIVTYVLHIIVYMIKPRFETKYDDSSRREYMNRLTASPSRRSDYVPVQNRTTTPVRPSVRTDRGAKTQKKKRKGDISTSPSGGYREISTSSRNSPTRNPSRSIASRAQQETSKTVKQSRKATSRDEKKVVTTTKRKQKSVAQVSDGIEITSKPKAAKRRTKLDPNMLPSSNVIAEDLKCMVCYSDFDKKGFMNVILCPQCKFPAHEEELTQWLFTSPQCPRCAQPIKGKMNNRLKMNESDYAKFIAKL